MIFSINELIIYLSNFFFLKKGDLIFTGTPAGVSSISIGDHLEGYLANEQVLDFHIK